MNVLLYVVSLTVLFSCSGKKESTQTQVTDSAEVNVATDMPKPVEPSSGKPTTKNGTDAGIWHYETTTDKEGRTVYKASTISPNLLEFDFPYAGGSTATLTIRKRESDTHVYIQVSKGQFNRSFQGGQARVRFDGNPPVTYSFSAAENGSANIIFFDADQPLIKKMKAAQNMVVDVEFAGQDKRQIEFRTAELTWNH